MATEIVPRIDGRIDWKRVPARVSVGLVLVWFVGITLIFALDIGMKGYQGGFSWREPVTFGAVLLMMGIATAFCLLVLRWLDALVSRPRRYRTRLQ